MRKLKVAILAGGISAEREVSLISGESVYQNCPRDKYTPYLLDPRDLLDEEKKLSFLKRLLEADVAFIALHGKMGEDGTIQGFLESLGIPYTGSGVLASALAIDKLRTKQIFHFYNIPTPPWVIIEKTKPIPSLSYPVVIKPQKQGSSVGVTIVKSEEELPSALELAFQYDPIVIGEKYIEGRELSVPILEMNGEPTALPIVEIIPDEGFYDYYHKYTPGVTKEVAPAPLESETEEKIKKLAISAFKALGCENFARVDLRLDSDDNPFILEINTIPGLTPLSLFPFSAKTMGISFPQLIDTIIQNALSTRKNEQARL
ncbi:D-alanine--D-alanine ligase [bacterium]|nr:D-alanine--D-alanine ligase [bacterium]